MFFGGWLDRHFFRPLSGSFENILLYLFFYFAQGTLPRPRYDQLMEVGWKFLLPLALLNLLVTGAILLIVK